MAAKRKTLWQVLAAQLLLVAVPLHGLAPELSALASSRGDWEPKTRLRVSSSALEKQPQALLRVIWEVASGDSFHAEGIGTIRALTNEAGEVTDRYTLEAFGTLLAHQGDDPNPYLFTGEPLDPNTGFYYNRARWLAPSIGEFGSQDPWLGASDTPSTLHRYLYAHSDPVGFSDPTGRSELSLPSLAVTSQQQAELRRQNASQLFPVYRGVRIKLSVQDIRPYGQFGRRIPGHEVHKLVERRFLDRVEGLRQVWPNYRRIPGIQIHRTIHRRHFTNPFQRYFPYGDRRPIPLHEFVRVLHEIYSKFPPLLRAILRDLEPIL